MDARPGSEDQHLPAKALVASREIIKGLR